jgi:hypothetical protein
VNYHFEVLKTTPVKGKKLEGAKDYETRVKVLKDDNSVIFDEVILVRKNKAGVFPETDSFKKLKSESARKELLNRIKEYFKKVK